MDNFKILMQTKTAIAYYNDADLITIVKDTTNNRTVIYKSFPQHKTVFDGITNSQSDIDFLLSLII